MSEDPRNPIVASEAQAAAGIETAAGEAAVGEAAASEAAALEVFDFRKSDAHVAQDSYELTQTVFFVGFMGAGKTSAARKLARLAGAAAIDMDTYIARRCDCKIPEMFAQAGEAAFRAIETETLRELAAGDPVLVSCGGGVVLRSENRAILKENGCTIYLQVTADEAASRISNLATRPLFGDIEQARRVIEERLPLYEEVADITINTAGRGSGAIAREVFACLKQKGILWQRK